MPASAFSVLKPPVLRRLEKEGFLEASPIQELAIPAILNGDNVLLIAPTGTGKTLAAILPVLDKFLEKRIEQRARGISVVYVTPLRALNRDLLRRLEEMGRDLDVKIQVRHGDTPISARSRQARIPPDILITTPETLQSILIGRRMSEILNIIDTHRSTLVFTNTREQAEALAAQLHALGAFGRVRVHHGSLSREVREESEKEFQEGRIRGLICTSSLELGIDIGSVDYIVQFTSPRETTRLVQRMGRSGHTLGGTSRGTVLTIGTDDILESVILVRRAREGRLERPIIHEKAWDVLAHQIVGLLLQKPRVSLDEMLQIFRRSYPFRETDAKELERVVRQLEDLRFVRKLGESYSPRNPYAIQYYFRNLSVIPDVHRYSVFY